MIECLMQHNTGCLVKDILTSKLNISKIIDDREIKQTVYLLRKL